MSTTVCYLCSKQIASQISGDHVVPKTLIEREQPRVKGYDYAGKLPSHPECNNRFGSETYATKALSLIAALHDPKATFKYKHPLNRSFSMLAINAAVLPDFTKRDLEFFKIIDAQNKTKEELYDLKLVEGRKPTNPIKMATFTALSVLTKSAAALVVSRHLKTVPVSWKVLAIPYVGDADLLDFDELFGTTLPFDREVKVWIGQLVTNDYLVAYRSKRVIVYFLFRFSSTRAGWNRMLSQFKGGSRLQFQGATLNELVNYQWREA